MFKSILVPIDIEHKSSWEFAIPEAMELARAGGAKVAAMTVVRDVKSMMQAVRLPYQLEQMIDSARRTLGAILDEFQNAGVEIEREVRWGSIGQEILAAAEGRKADLIVMASHRPEMLDYLIGPNAAHVAQHARCSVLVVRKFSKK